MNSTDFKESNFKLLAGDNPNTNDMPACRAVDLNGTKFIIGKFTMDEQERKRFLETGELWICVMGSGWPPMLPTVFDPFAELGFTPKAMVRGLPLMNHRTEIEAMLKDVFWNENMTENQWLEFLEMVGETYPLQKIADEIDKALSKSKVETVFNRDKVKEKVIEVYRQSIVEALIFKMG